MSRTLPECAATTAPIRFPAGCGAPDLGWASDRNCYRRDPRTRISSTARLSAKQEPGTSLVLIEL
eukprot:9624647-Alexandrium_andersonii.AAC.1